MATFSMVYGYLVEIFSLCIWPIHMITKMTVRGMMVRSDRVVGANNVGPTSPLQPNKDILLRICLVVQDPTLTEESNQSRWKISLKLPDGISSAQKNVIDPIVSLR